MGRFTRRCVSDRQNNDFLTTRIIGRGQQNRAGAIFGAFFAALLLFAAPKISVANDHTGLWGGESHNLDFEFLIKSLGFF